jgi:hypothetical protein
MRKSVAMLLAGIGVLWAPCPSTAEGWRWMDIVGPESSAAVDQLPQGLLVDDLHT